MSFAVKDPIVACIYMGWGVGKVVKSYGFRGNLNSEYPGTCSVKTYRLMLFLTLHFYFKLKKKRNEQRGKT